MTEPLGRFGEPPFVTGIYTIDPARIPLLRFLTEGYDGLLFVRTRDPHRALVEIAYSPSRRTEAEGLLAALARECGLVAVDAP